jgi:hypothetical protein
MFVPYKSLILMFFMGQSSARVEKKVPKLLGVASKTSAGRGRAGGESFFSEKRKIIIW